MAEEPLNLAGNPFYRDRFLWKRHR